MHSILADSQFVAVKAIFPRLRHWIYLSPMGCDDPGNLTDPGSVFGVPNLKVEYPHRL